MPVAALRRLSRLAIGALAVVVASTLVTGIAGGDEIGDKKAQAAAIAAKIEGLNAQTERDAEAANGAQVALDAVNQQIAEAQSRVADAQALVDQQRGQLRSYAVDAYVRGTDDAAADYSTAGGTDPNSVGIAQGYLSAATSNGQQAVDQLNAAQEDLATQLRQLDTNRAAAEANAKVLADKRASAQSAVDQQRALYNQAQGELAGLLRAEQDRRAAEQATAATQRAAQAAQSGRTPRGPAALIAVPNAPAPDPGAYDPGPAPAPNGNVDAVIARAKAQLGKPYEWGAAGPDSFDCSGLTMYAWQAAGVYLPHYAKSQYDATAHISIDQLQPGDLVFYNGFGHEAMYIGNGQVIDAPHTGAYVQIVSLYWAGTPHSFSRPG